MCFTGSEMKLGESDKTPVTTSSANALVSPVGVTKAGSLSPKLNYYGNGDKVSMYAKVTALNTQIPVNSFPVGIHV